MHLYHATITIIHLAHHWYVWVVTDFGHLLSNRGAATSHHCHHWAVSNHLIKNVKCSCLVALISFYSADKKQVLSSKWVVILCNLSACILLLTSVSLTIYSRRCPGRIVASVLISSSVWFTADITVEESGLLLLATISRNLRGETGEAPLKPADRRRLSASRKIAISVAIGPLLRTVRSQQQTKLKQFTYVNIHTYIVYCGISLITFVN